MNCAEMALKLNLETLCAPLQDKPLQGAFTSDLLSDVMGKAEAGQVLVTIQAHKNTVAVAVLAGMPAIIICSERPAAPDMLEAAQKEGIAVYRTALNQYQCSGRLYCLFEGN